MPRFEIPRETEEYYQITRDDLREFLSEMAWELDPVHEDGAMASKEFTNSIGDSTYSVRILISEEEGSADSIYTYKSVMNIDGIRRDDIEDLDYVRDKELKEMLSDKGMTGAGIGPKTYKRLLLIFETRCMTEAYKILNRYARLIDED
jgi:hypothetical protein